MSKASEVCFRCKKPLDGRKKIRVGMYGVRGIYCSSLCAYLCQPGWVDKTIAVREIVSKLEKGYFEIHLDSVKPFHNIIASLVDEYGKFVKEVVVKPRKDGVLIRITR